MDAPGGGGSMVGADGGMADCAGAGAGAGAGDATERKRKRRGWGGRRDEGAREEAGGECDGGECVVVAVGDGSGDEDEGGWVARMGSVTCVDRTGLRLPVG